MSLGISRVREPSNEVVRGYAPGSAERASLEAELKRQTSEVIEIPCVVNGKRIFTGNTVDVIMPSDKHHVLAKLHLAGPKEMAMAVDTAEAARAEWAALPWEQRASVFLKAATLLAGPWRDRVNAATMLGQAKTCHQAEIDAACELIDFWRFNVSYLAQILADQPPVSPAGIWNRLEHRPLDGFVLAIAPFNFTSISGNLPSAPALMGNTAIWKPASTSALSCWQLMLLMEEAGLPPGVINMINAHGPEVGEHLLTRPELGGIHFTGSTGTFQTMWKTVGDNIARYRQYPRIVGETGGKDFIIAHPSADARALAVAIARGGFEYQGQKCSAASRIYVPRSLWTTVSEQVVAMMAEMKQGDVRDFSNFVSAVIDDRAFKKHCGYLEHANQSGTVLSGGKANGECGFYIEPTFVQVNEPDHLLMREEIFGPIVSAWVYDDDQWAQALQRVDQTSPYALTGAVFSQSRQGVQEAMDALRYSAGNFYINDKPTGAVVGQQPFGGGRASGTNDKAGSPLNLLRWVSPRTIKENFNPPHDWRYPFLG